MSRERFNVNCFYLYTVKKCQVNKSFQGIIGIPKICNLTATEKNHVPDTYLHWNADNL